MLMRTRNSTPILTPTPSAASVAAAIVLAGLLSATTIATTIGTTAATTIGTTAATAAEDLGALKNAYSAASRTDDVPEMIRVIGALSALDSPQAADFLLLAGARTSSVPVFEACARAFSATRQEAVVDRIARSLRAKLPSEACLAAEILTGLEGFREKAREELVKAFLDLRPYPRTDAVQAIVLEWLKGNRGETWALRALIDMRARLSKRKIADGRLYYGVVEALWDLTGQEYSDAADWEKYWQARVAPGGWKPQEKPDPAARAAAPGGRTAVAGTVPSFFGRKVHSDRALFIIDVSGSMEKVDPGQAPDDYADEDAAEEREKGPSGKTVVRGAQKSAQKKASDEPSFGEPGARTRIERVKRQLYRMVRRYPAGRHFAILAYSTEVTPIVAVEKGAVLQPVLMDPRTRADALKKIVELEAEGLTRTDEAFETAFRFEGIDTIYLLSDGYPQRDVDYAQWPKDKQKKVTADLVEEILDLVTRKNRIAGRRWHVHTLGFPQAGLASFLGKLARDNHGEFSEVK